MIHARRSLLYALLAAVLAGASAPAAEPPAKTRYFEFRDRSNPGAPALWFVSPTSDPELQSILEKELARPWMERSLHPIGKIQPEHSGLNPNGYGYAWSWQHMDGSWKMGTDSAELCHGLAPGVESQLDYWFYIGSFCPAGVRVYQEVDPPAAPQFNPCFWSDDFQDGNATDWSGLASEWTVVNNSWDKVYRGNTKLGASMSLAPKVAQFSAGSMFVGWTPKTGASSRVYFNYLDPANYRWLEIVATQKTKNWKLCEKIGGLTAVRATATLPVSYNLEYGIKITISEKGLTTVWVNGTPVTKYAFAAPPAGRVGLGVGFGSAWFDYLCVRNVAAAAADLED